MPKNYTKEQLWKLYEKLPQEIKETVFSNETAESIHNACANNEIKDENISRVAVLVGDVLLGILPPEDFQETLEKELNLEEKIAEKIAQEINRFIFYPIKPALEQLYQKEITFNGKADEASTKKELREKPTAEKPEIESESPKKILQRDTYREPIE